MRLLEMENNPVIILFVIILVRILTTITYRLD